MSNELTDLNDIRESSVPPGFNEARANWDNGEMSSQAFFPLAIKKLLTTNHLLGNGETPLRSIPPEEFERRLNESPIFTGAFERGFSGNRPDIYTEQHMESFFSFLPTKKIQNRYTLQFDQPGQVIDSWEFKMLDEKLPESLLLHAFMAERSGSLYRERNERVYLAQFRQAVYQNIPGKDDATTVLLWLHYRGLLSKVKNYQVKSVLRITDEENFTYVYPTFEDLARSISPLAYFSGWEERLKNRNDKRGLTLPPNERSTMAKKVLLAAYFSFGDQRRPGQAQLLKQALESIERTGGTDEIRQKYAELQAESIITKAKSRPFKIWEIRSMALSEEVEQAVNAAKIPEQTKEKTEGTKPIVSPPEVSPEPQGETSVKEISSEEVPVVTQDRVIDRQPPNKKRVEILKESLLTPGWGTPEFQSFTFALLEGNEALLKSEEYPDSIEITNRWYEAMSNLQDKQFNNLRRLFGAQPSSNKVGFTLLTPVSSHEKSAQYLQRRDSLIAKYQIDPVVADIVPASKLSLVSTEIPIVPIERIHTFLTDTKKIPLLGVTMQDRRYLLFRGADTIGIPPESSYTDDEQFKAYWYHLSGIRLTGNIESFFNIDEISYFSASRNRRDPVLQACRSHKLALFEAINSPIFKRIA